MSRDFPIATAPPPVERSDVDDREMSRGRSSLEESGGRTRLQLSGADRAALAIVLLHLLPVFWLVVGGGLYLDDLRAQAYARSQPFWSFIFSSNSTHLAPGARTVDWLQAHHAPLEHWPAVVITLGVHLCLGAVAWLLLRELVGPRAGALVPLTVLLLTPGVVSATAWYRQALTTLVPTVFVLAATLCAVRFVRTRSWPWGASAVGLICGGLLFSERAVAGCALVVVTAAAVTLHDSTARGSRPSVRDLTRPALLAVPLAVVVVAYVAVYRSGPYDQGTTGGLHVSDGLSLLAASLGQSVVPALFGGPWQWRPSGPALSVTDTPTALVITCCAVLIASLVLAGWRRRDRWRVVGALLVAAAYVVPVVAFVFIGRYAAFGTGVASDIRLFADCVIVLSVALAVVFLRLRPADSGTGTDPSRVAPSRGALARRAGVRLLTAAFLAAFALGATISWAGFGNRWHTGQTQDYVERLRAELPRSTGVGGQTSMTVLPGSIPDDVIPGWMQAEISTLDLVALLSPSTELTLSAQDTSIVSDRGRLVPGKVTTVQQFDPGDSTFCRHRAAPGATEPLTITAPNVVDHKRNELVELGLLVNDESRIRVDVVGSDGAVTPLTWPHPTTLARGPYVVRLRVPHGIDIAAVRVHPTPSGFCVVSAKAVVPEVAR